MHVYNIGVYIYIDYYHANSAERFFCEEVEKKNYNSFKAIEEGRTLETVEPFLGIKRAANAIYAK